jgi:uncharacterized protein (DUF1778 family)
MSKVIGYQPTEVISMRLSAEEKERLVRAALATNRNLSSYLRDCGLTKAREILATEQRAA